jgi:hypothetical protein
MAKYDEKIKELEDRISSTKYNKKTQHAIGQYKAQIAKLREAQEARSSGGGKGHGYQVRKSGDGTVILLGFPSVGKSTLLNKLTGANSDIGAYEFTTLDVVPGVMKHKHAEIQICDMPGIVKGAASGKGRGKEVLATLQSADLILMLLDVNSPQYLKVIEKEIYDAHVRINQRKPDVKIKKTSKGGIKIGKTVRLKNLTNETIISILKTFRINNADVVIRDKINADQLIDIIAGNKLYIPAITVFNKIDTVSKTKLKQLKKKYHPDLCISAQKDDHIEELKELIYKKLDLMRIYLKEPTKDADMDVPLIVPKNSKIRDVCNKLHRDFVKKFKFARVWGSSAKFGGQKLMLKHKLKDQDILELHMF